MNRGDCVRLVSLKEINDTAERLAYPSGNVLVPAVGLGDVGTVIEAVGNNLFNVAFEKATIICNDVMVELVLPVTTFELAIAEHIPGPRNERVLARRFVDGREVNRGWFESHRLDEHSPTGVNGVIECLRRES